MTISNYYIICIISCFPMSNEWNRKSLQISVVKTNKQTCKIAAFFSKRMPGLHLPCGSTHLNPINDLLVSDVLFDDQPVQFVPYLLDR